MVQVFTIYVFWIIVCYIMGTNKINFLYDGDPYKEVMTNKQKNQVVGINLIVSFLWFLTIPLYMLMYFLEWWGDMILKKRDYSWYCFLKHNQYITRFELRYGRQLFDFKNKTKDDGMEI